jgi:hypothetical protein
MLKEVKWQRSNLKRWRKTMPSSLADATPRGNWMKRSVVIEITKTQRTNSFNRGSAVSTNGFENRTSKLELANCLLSGSARKVDLISEVLDGRETESEIINKTPP